MPKLLIGLIFLNFLVVVLIVGMASVTFEEIQRRLRAVVGQIKGGKRRGLERRR